MTGALLSIVSSWLGVNAVQSVWTMAITLFLFVSRHPTMTSDNGPENKQEP